MSAFEWTVTIFLAAILAASIATGSIVGDIYTILKGWKP